MQEVSGAYRDVLMISELRGQYPTVPISGDVDYAALVMGDESPTFVTLPIGKVGVTSRNKRHYDEAFVNELLRQTLANKPIGLMGHLSEQERATSFRAEAVHWVGAVLEQGIVWGKGYVPPGEARARLERYKATGKSIATSIDAEATGVWDESLSAYRMKADTLRLGQIDIAPADRAGIPDLAAVPVLTRELVQEQKEETSIEQEPEMDKLTVINEMTADDARLLPSAVREAIVSSIPPAPEIAQVQELRQLLGVDASGDLAKLVKTMQEKQIAQEQAEISDRITELAEDAEKGIRIESVRGLVIELVAARQPKSVGEVETIYEQVVALPSVANALQETVQRTMGPRQTTSVAPQHQPEGKYFRIPKEG